MHLLKHSGRLALRGEYRIVRIDFRKMMDAPCIGHEHRHGICPFGIDHAQQEYAGSNTIVTSLKESVIKQLAKVASPLDLGVDYIACGTSSIATTGAMTTLDAETFRDVPTDAVATSATQFDAYWYFGVSQANAGSDLQEWGIFAGAATSTTDSGTMIARFLQQFDKNATTTASGQYTLSVA